MALIGSLAMNVAFFAVAGYGYFQNRHTLCPVAGGPFETDHHLYEALGLSPSQLKPMTAMAASFHRRLNRLYAEMEIKKDAMIGMLNGNETDEDQVEALRRNMADIQDKIQQTVIAHILAVKKILNPDQRKRFFALLHASMTDEGQAALPAGEN